MKVSSIPVNDLIGRTCENENGAEFRIIDVRYDLHADAMVVEMVALPDLGDRLTSVEPVAVASLKGWTVH